MAVKFLVYSRWGEYVRELTGVERATHKQEINREDTLFISGFFVLAKGDRILWRDGDTWREHVVNEINQRHDDEESMEYVCEPAHMADLRADHVEIMSLRNVTAEHALSLVIELTSWSIGTVDDFGIGSFTLQKVSSYEALLEVAGTWGCEIQPSIEVDESGVVSRKISLLKKIGSDNGVRFEYGRGMSGVQKQVLSDDVITACFGYGKSLETDDFGVTKYLTFEAINDGLAYVTVEDSVLEMWGIPDGKGGVRHVFGCYENSQCDDEQQLLDETIEHLAQYSTPQVSYETEIPFASLNGVHLGDTVQVIDLDFTPELRLEARIGAMDRNLISGETSSCTFGSVVSILPDVYARLFKVAESTEEATNIEIDSVGVETIRALFAKEAE